jgi:hypothetical protein
VSSAGLAIIEFESLNSVMVMGAGCLKKALVGKYICFCLRFCFPFSHVHFQAHRIEDIIYDLESIDEGGAALEYEGAIVKVKNVEGVEC